MIHCGRCGSSEDASAVQCSACGAALRSRPVPEIEAPRGGMARGSTAEVGHTRDRTAPVRAEPVHSSSGGSERVVGDVIVVDRHEDRAPPNGWRIATKLCLFVALFPIALAVVLFAFVLMIMGFSFIGGMLLGIVLPGGRRSGEDQVPIYTYQVRDDLGTVHEVRQHGELWSGRVLTHNRIDVFGHRRYGTLVLQRGTNLTTGSALVMPPNFWKFVFFILAIAGAVAFVAASSQGR